jgi:signal transduction histidine kinase
MAALCPEERFHNDFPKTDALALSAEFMHNQKLQRVCCSVFTFEQDKAPYAVSVYRKGSTDEGIETPLFDSDDARQLDIYARLIPFLVRRHLDGHFRSLIRDVHQALSPAKTREGKGINETLDKLCTKLAEAFHCQEVSILIREDGKDSDYTIRASTIGKNALSKSSYRADRKDGLTGYALETGKTLEFHDLMNFRDPLMIPIIQEGWGEINWNDSADILTVWRNLHADLADEILPPLAFLAVPIVEPDASDSSVDSPLGLIRCSVGTNPYYFTSAEKDMLALVSASLGHWWSDVMAVNDQKRRAQLFEASLRVHERLQLSIWKAIHEKDSVEDGVNSAAVKEASTSFKGLNLVCFRRLIEREHERVLRISEIALSGPNGLSLQSGSEFKRNEYPLAIGLLESKADSFVWRTATEIGASASDKERQLFSGMQEVLSVRVGLPDYVVGVIDFGFVSALYDAENRKHFQSVTQDIARQVALYEQICLNRRDLEKALEDQIAMTEIVGHQVKSPLANARDVLDQLNRPLLEAQQYPHVALTLGRRLEKQAQKIPRLLGMVGKAQAVGRFMESFGKLSRGERVVLSTNLFTVSTFSRLCKEIARNNQVSEESREEVGFLEGNLADREFQFTGDLAGSGERREADVTKIRYSRNATEQILDAVVGNALKYSRAGGNVEMRADFVDPFFELRISNWADEKLILTKKGAAQCFNKSWRGPGTAGHIGSGLGLWIAKELMKQQKGHIDAVPTTAEGKTTFVLKLPTQSQHQ